MKAKARSGTYITCCSVTRRTVRLTYVTKSELARRIFHFNLTSIKSGLGPSISVKTRDEKAPSHPQTVVGASTTWDESDQSNQVDRVELTSGIFGKRTCRHRQQCCLSMVVMEKCAPRDARSPEQFARLGTRVAGAVGNGRERGKG
jgi:hypothetical protein